MAKLRQRWILVLDGSRTVKLVAASRFETCKIFYLVNFLQSVKEKKSSIKKYLILYQ